MRLAWDAHWDGVHADHVGAFEQRMAGYVLTEETQNGCLARLGGVYSE
jgi:hypothetical protein